MPAENTPQTVEVVQEILRAIQDLRYGSVEITLHEGRVTQIERREKMRFGAPAALESKPHQQEQLRSKPTAKTAANT